MTSCAATITEGRGGAVRKSAEAVAVERTRIAREIHDVVAHSLTVAVVQCVAAGDDLDSGAAQTETVRTRVKAAEGTCREALDELRRMLGVLRFGPEQLEPVPRLAVLQGLCGAITDAGIPVELELTGDLDTLPPGVELNCYRIVQEALTNTLKHSGARRAEVRSPPAFSCRRQRSKRTSTACWPSSDFETGFRRWFWATRAG